MITPEKAVYRVFDFLCYPLPSKHYLGTFELNTYPAPAKQRPVLAEIELDQPREMGEVPLPRAQHSAPAGS